MKAAFSRAEKLGTGRPEDVKNPVLCLLEYNDGFRASVLMLGGLVSEYLVAFRLPKAPSKITVNGKDLMVGHPDEVLDATSYYFDPASKKCRFLVPKNKSGAQGQLLNATEVKVFF